MEQMSISSFLKNGHSFHLYVYNDVQGLPRGTILKDANDIIPKNRIFKYKHHDSYAGFSNLFRYKLLYEKGGYWVDTDVVCLKPFQFKTDHAFLCDKKRYAKNLFIMKRHRINGWFIKAPAGSAIMKYCYTFSEKQTPEDLLWGDIGPRLITRAVKKFKMEEFMTPYYAFCPIFATQYKQLINSSFIASWKWKKALKRSYGVHLYNEMWRRNNIDKNGRFPSTSIYEQLKRRYLSSSDAEVSDSNIP